MKFALLLCTLFLLCALLHAGKSPCNDASEAESYTAATATASTLSVIDLQEDEDEEVTLVDSDGEDVGTLALNKGVAGSSSQFMINSISNTSIGNAQIYYIGTDAKTKCRLCEIDCMGNVVLVERALNKKKKMEGDRVSTFVSPFTSCQTRYYRYGCHINDLCVTPQSASRAQVQTALALCMLHNHCQPSNDFSKSVESFLVAAQKAKKALYAKYEATVDNTVEPASWNPDDIEWKMYMKQKAFHVMLYDWKAFFIFKLVQDIKDAQLPKSRVRSTKAAFINKYTGLINNVTDASWELLEKVSQSYLPEDKFYKKNLKKILLGPDVNVAVVPFDRNLNYWWNNVAQGHISIEKFHDAIKTWIKFEGDQYKNWVLVSNTPKNKKSLALLKQVSKDINDYAAGESVTGQTLTKLRQKIQKAIEMYDRENSALEFITTFGSDASLRAQIQIFIESGDTGLDIAKQQQKEEADALIEKNKALKQKRNKMASKFSKLLADANTKLNNLTKKEKIEMKKCPSGNCNKNNDV